MVLQYAARESQNKLRPYIFPDVKTTEAVIIQAPAMIKAQQGWRSPEGRSRRDKLMAVQCAILVDRYGWSCKWLAKHYDRDSEDTAEKYAKYGRKLRG